MTSTQLNSSYYLIRHPGVEHFNQVNVWDEAEVALRYEEHLEGFDEEDEIKLEKIDVTPDDCVIIEYWDDECTTIAEKGAIHKVAVNSTKEAALLANTQSQHWGGHCSVLRLKVIEQSKSTKLLPTKELGFAWLIPDYADLL